MMKYLLTPFFLIILFFMQPANASDFGEMFTGDAPAGLGGEASMDDIAGMLGGLEPAAGDEESDDEESDDDEDEEESED